MLDRVPFVEVKSNLLIKRLNTFHATYAVVLKSCTRRRFVLNQRRFNSSIAEKTEQASGFDKLKKTFNGK